MSKQLKKYMAVSTASFMVLQLAACGSGTEEITGNVHTITNNTDNTVVETTEEVDTEEIYEVPDNLTPEEYANAVVREQLVDVTDSDMANACEEWQEDEDGSYECLDEDSPYYTEHFFNGLLFATAGAMIGSSLYKSHNLKNGTEKERIRSSAIVSPTNTRGKANDQNNTATGGGSYSGRFKTNTNGTVTNGSNGNTSSSTSSNSNTNTNGSTLNKSNTTSSGTNSNNSNTTSSGTNSNNSNSYSSGNNSNSSNSYSNGSSSNTGKSGFGSGGGSRGGSSSS